MHNVTLSRVTTIVLLALALFAVLTPILAQTTYAIDPPPRLLPDCKAWLFPKDAGSCNLTKFQELLVRVIRWLLWVLIPIAVFILVWAGFMILTSAGNAEKVHKAYGMIKIVAIGIVIAALSYLIITTVLKAINYAGTVTPISQTP
jgi:hypothetical protein